MFYAFEAKLATGDLFAHPNQDRRTSKSSNIKVNVAVLVVKITTIMASPRADANHTGNLLDDSNSDEKLAQFMACTNAPENEAKHWLEVSNPDVD